MNLKETKFAVIDLETTGLKKDDEILAVAVVPMTGVRIYPGEAYYTLVKPKRFRIESCKFHGIDPKMLKEAPEFSEIANTLHYNLNGRILVGFSVDFDYEILKIHLSKEKINLVCKTLDVVNLECIILELSSNSVRYEELTFENLAKKYGLKVSHRHNALFDAFTTAQIFQLQLLKLLKFGIRSTTKLFEIYDECVDKRIRFFIT